MSETTKKKKKNTIQQVVSHFLLITFATPTALGVIAQIDKDLDFYSLLEIAVIGYRTLIDQFSIFLQRVGLDWLSSGTTLFCLFLTVQIFTALILRKMDSPLDEHGDYKAPEPILRLLAIATLPLFFWAFNAEEALLPLLFFGAVLIFLGAIIVTLSADATRKAYLGFKKMQKISGLGYF